MTIFSLHSGTFPAREIDRRVAARGVIERGRFAPTEQGTPQGGVISPILLNIALHGMEEAAGVRYLRSTPTVSEPGRTRRCWCDTPTTSSSCVTPRKQAETGLAPAGGVAGPTRPDDQRGEDPRSCTSTGLRLLGVQHPPSRRKAAHQTQPGGDEAHPGTDRRGGAHPAWARTPTR